MDFYDIHLAATLDKKLNLLTIDEGEIQRELNRCEERKGYYNEMIDNCTVIHRKHVCHHMSSGVLMHLKIKSLKEKIEDCKKVKAHNCRKKRVLRRLLQDDQVVNTLCSLCSALVSYNKAKKHMYTIGVYEKKLISRTNTVKREYRSYESFVLRNEKRMMYFNNEINGYKNRLAQIQRDKDTIDDEISKAIDTIHVMWKDKYQEAEETCPICLEDDTKVIKTRCNHFFHVECIMPYVHRAINDKYKPVIEIKCPMCRQYI